MPFINSWLESWNNSYTMWIWFCPFAFITIFSALKMVKYAEFIIEKTKLGGAFIGFVLVSFITSIPELITEISQSVLGKPSIGISDISGANAFTIFMVAISFFCFLKFIKKSNIDNWTKFSVFISFILSIIMVFVLFYGFDYSIGSSKYIVLGVFPIFIFVTYLIITFFSYKFKKNQGEDENKENKSISKKISMKKIIFNFIFFSSILVISALFLNWVVGLIQKTYYINEKSVGGILLSMTTALPEAIALFSFMKKGYLDAAIGSIIGSQIFNLSCIFWGDIAFSHNAIILVSSVRSVWSVFVIVSVELFILFFTLFFIRNKFVYFSGSFLIVLTYFVGWILILFL